MALKLYALPQVSADARRPAPTPGRKNTCTHTHTYTQVMCVPQGLTRRLGSRPRMARSSFWTTLRTCVSQHSLCLRSRSLPPASCRRAVSSARALAFFSLRGLLSGLLSPQGLQLFFSLSQNSSLRLRTCPSSRLGVALALGVFQALALVGATIPLTFALLAPSLCSQALSH